MAHLNVPPVGSLRVGIVWLIALVAASWYVGSLADDNGGVVGWLVIVAVFALTAALGAALSVQGANWLWLDAAAPVGSLVATVVVSVAVFSVPNNLDSFYPHLLFVEILVVLLVPLAIGAIVGLSWRALRRVRSR